MNPNPPPGISPANAKSYPAWPTWKKVLAYALLSLVSVAAIWFVDVKVHRTAIMPRTDSVRSASKP